MLTTFPQSHLSLTVGAVLTLLVLGARTLSSDVQLREDLGAALGGRGELSVRAGGVEVSRLTRGNYFGEMLLLTGEPRTATVVALTDVVLLELDRPVFARLFDEHPELAPKLSGMLAHRRTQLHAAMTASGESLEVTEEHHILGRLKSIFRLS